MPNEQFNLEWQALLAVLAGGLDVNPVASTESMKIAVEGAAELDVEVTELTMVAQELILHCYWSELATAPVAANFRRMVDEFNAPVTLHFSNLGRQTVKKPQGRWFMVRPAVSSLDVNATCSARIRTKF